jgi:hypothetical protein
VDHKRTGAAPIIRVPGVPLRQSQTLAKQNALAATGSLAAIPGTILDSEAQRVTAYRSNADWLREINRWRTATGGTPIGENPDLSAGSAKHAEYLGQERPERPVSYFSVQRRYGVLAVCSSAGRCSAH